MNELKMLFSISAVIALNGVGTERALAHEPGDFGQYTRGITIGDPLGATPPPGLYFENIALYVPGASGQGQLGAFKANGLLDAPTFLWSTGYSFLGANLAVLLSQPFYQAEMWGGSAAGPPYGGVTLYPTVHNTWVSPFTLSWNLGGGLFASAGFDFYIPDGSRYVGTMNPDYWTFEPRASVSYLANGWDLTGTFLYNFNMASGGRIGPFPGTPTSIFGVGYRSGDQAFLDVTATKKFDKWEIGPVAYFAWQTTFDSPGGGFSCGAMRAVSAGALSCGRETDYALGAMVGYDFGPVSVKTYFTDSVYTKDAFGGLSIWTKLSFKLWGPDAPLPKSKGLLTK